MKIQFDNYSPLGGAGFVPPRQSPRVAIVGSGIAGLGCANALLDRHPDARLTLFEAAPRLGGHTNTVDVTLDGQSFPVDTGFLVFNERTYPHLCDLFASLDIAVANSDMSFGVSVPIASRSGTRSLEWAGTDLGTLFAQRRNLVDARFLSMVRDILRFNRAASARAAGAGQGDAPTLGEFLDAGNYGAPFRDWYLLPMAAAIWSCPRETMLAYPLDTFARFCLNHGLLSVTNRPQWKTVKGGARRYVQRIAARLDDVRLGEAVRSVSNTASGRVRVRTGSGGNDNGNGGGELFDDVVLACHSDQAAAMLGDAHAAARALLSKIAYQPNRAVLHTDARLMPKSRRVWSSWNYLSDGAESPSVCVSYWLNRLQPLPVDADVFVTLNPIAEPEQVLASFDYSHPVFDAAAIAAQNRLTSLQGRDSIWFAGAWTGYGFHEDGLKSGLAVASAIAARDARAARSQPHAQQELRRAA